MRVLDPGSPLCAISEVKHEKAPNVRGAGRSRGAESGLQVRDRARGSPDPLIRARVLHLLPEPMSERDHPSTPGPHHPVSALLQRTV
ncbi:MAG: hypothetical protein AAFY84_17650 [Pseudomonadota bacterium]